MIVACCVNDKMRRNVRFNVIKLAKKNKGFRRDVLSPIAQIPSLLNPLFQWLNLMTLMHYLPLTTGRKMVAAIVSKKLTSATGDPLSL